MTRAGTSRRSSGKSGGENERRIRSRRLSTGERGPPDLDADAVIPERREEAEALEVVEVQVGQEEVDRAVCRVEEVEAKRADTGAGIQDERRVVVEQHLDAGRVAAVRHGVGAGGRNRASTAPDLQAHRHVGLAPPEDAR